MQKDIYIVAGVSVKHLSQQDLKDQYEILKIQMPVWQKRSFDKFVAWKKGIHQARFEVHSEELGYYLDFASAANDVMNNYLDLNDGGLYPYAVIYSRKANTIYPLMFESDVKIYKFNDGKYESVKADSDELRFIANQFKTI